jgi:lysophospholipase L1-like esterase
MKLIFLGDSLTWGGYGGDTVGAVRDRLPDHTIINAGEGGNTVLNLVRRLDSIIMLEPDGVFVMIGGNDAISHSQPATRRYYEKVQGVLGGRISPLRFGSAYRDLLRRLHDAGITAWVGLPPVEYNPAVVAALAAFNAEARAAAASLGVRVLDLTAHFSAGDVPDRPPLDGDSINLIGERTRAGWTDYETARLTGDFTFTFDGLHFTPATADQAAALIVDFLAPDLTSDTGAV